MKNERDFAHFDFSRFRLCENASKYMQMDQP